MSLQEYVRKRDFQKTAEPRGAKPRTTAKAPRFVIQKHAASHLHYDFRLELDGALKSWAVPKGVPFAKGDKRLAVQVEDHPVEYAAFEGSIPAGEYGGGTVMVWDEGIWQTLGGDPRQDLAAGKLHFQLQGKKLQGEWTLVRIHGEETQWLLLKSGEDVRPVTKKKDDESAVTGRSMSRIARDKEAKRSPQPKAKKEPEEKLDFIEPMKATLAAKPPVDGGWLYELKFDGYRALALKSGKEVRLLSSNGKDFNARFPEIVEAVAAIPVKQAIFDGELVALDAEGRSSFQLLQASELGTERPPLAFYIFDLLHEGGTDLRGKPLHTRRGRLGDLLKNAAEPIRYSANIFGDPRRLVEKVRQLGLEGIIGKLPDSLYETGRRSKSWIKLKCVYEQEMVIGGFTPPEGTRQHFGALLVGYFEKGKLRFAGKVGTGFDAARLKSLHSRMSLLASEKCPFANLPEKSQGRWSQNITPREMKLCHWIEPQLVCQVKFTEWTRDGKLRHPVFLGLRDDKAAEKVVRERPQA